MQIENTTKIIIGLVIIAFALCVADDATTYVAVSNGAQEMNPLVASHIETYGLTTALYLTMPVPIFATVFCVGGSMVVNNTLNKEMGLSIRERKSVKMFVAVGLSFLVTVIIFMRGFAVVNNLSGLIAMGII